MKTPRWFTAIIAMFITAAAALAAVLLLTPPRATPIQANLARCTTTVQSSYRTGPGGYSRVHVVVGCQYVQAKALCKLTPTIGKTVYGPTGKATGFTSTAYCPSNYTLAGAWFQIGSSGWIRIY